VTSKHTKYYRLLGDRAATAHWQLGSPTDLAGNDVDPRLFTEGVPVGPQPPLAVFLRQLGEEVDFNFCDFDMIVTSSALNAELEELVGPSVVQRIPVSVGGHTNKFEILNVCELIQCIDETKSSVTKWTAADGRPEKISQIRMITELKINPQAALGHHIFRLAGWPIALIVSEEVKDLFDAKGVRGLNYERVD
jgi:hypothetical protein